MATPWWLGTTQVPVNYDTAVGSMTQEVDKRTGQPVFLSAGKYYYGTDADKSYREDLNGIFRGFADENGYPVYYPLREFLPIPGQDEDARTATFVTDAAKGLAAPYGNLGGEVGVIDGKMSYLYPMDRGASIDGDLGVYGGAQRARWTSPSQSKGTVVKGPDGNFWVAPPADARFSESDTADHETMLGGAWRDFGPIITAVLGGMYGAGTFGGGADAVGGGMASMAEQSAINSAISSAADAALGGGLKGVGAAAGNGAGTLGDVASTRGVAAPADGGASWNSGYDVPSMDYPGGTLSNDPLSVPPDFKLPGIDLKNPLDIKRGMLQAIADSGIPAEIWQNLPAGISTAQTIAKLAPYFGDSSGPLSAYAKMLSGAKTPAIIDSTSSALGQMNSALTTDEGKYPSPIKPYLQPQTLSTGPLGQTPPMFQGIDPKLIAQMDRRGYAMGGPVNPVEYVAGPEDRYYARHQKRGFAVNGPGTGQSDDIPTMLADGEYVIDSDTVAALGDGSSKAGASVLDKFREEIRQHKRSAPVNSIPPKARDAMQYLKEAQKGKKNG